MITFQNADTEFDRLNDRQHQILDEILDGLPIMDENALIEKGQSLNAPELSGREMFFRLTEGNVAANYGERVLFHYEPGDLVGVESMLGTAVTSSQLELAVRADIYDKEKILKKIRKDASRNELLWEYFAVCGSMLQVLLANSMKASHRPNFQLKQIPAGTAIIKQGATDTDVYSLVSGCADVLVNAKKVGEIHEDEVFGEMSRLTGEPRSATVLAACDCEVMVFGGNDFSSLAENNPAALMDIARSLSERLRHVNQEATDRK